MASPDSKPSSLHLSVYAVSRAVLSIWFVLAEMAFGDSKSSFHQDQVRRNHGKGWREIFVLRSE
jgi:hypothetical protein